MQWPDLVNGTFEFLGAFAVGLSIARILKDKLVSGVAWGMTAFFATWGIWNLYYYPSLGQWASFVAGVAVCSTNLIYTGLLIYYTRNPGGKR